jgi:DNA-binding response OmpR family regulator
MNRQRAKLLVADCHEDTLIDLQRVLEDAGFDTTAVWTSREFVDAIHCQAFDLALINEYMPGAPCQELLQLVRDADLRCVMLQARTPPATGPATLNAGHGCRSVCKHDHAGIVRLVSDILGDGEKHIPAA